MTPVVECYAGSTYPERPRAFHWEDQRYEVQSVINQRREPAGVGFLVRCSPDDALFDLFYQTDENTWQIRPKGFVNQKEKPRPPSNTQGG
jgi:hypothetical protein